MAEKQIKFAILRVKFMVCLAMIYFSILAYALASSGNIDLRILDVVITVVCIIAFWKLRYEQEEKTE